MRLEAITEELMKCHPDCIILTHGFAYGFVDVFSEGVLHNGHESIQQPGSPMTRNLDLPRYVSMAI